MAVTLDGHVGQTYSGNAVTKVAVGILPINGYVTGGYTDLAGGGIIRLKRTLYKTQTSFSMTAGVLYDVGNLFSVSITPTNASSRFIINCRFAGESSVSHNTLFHVMRNGSSITVPTVGFFDRAYGLLPQGESYAANAANDATTPAGCDFWWMDHPNTTSSVTYSYGILKKNNNDVVYINRTQSDGATGNERLSSAITVMEVTG